MKGAVGNLRLSSAALGVLVIPTLNVLEEQAKEHGTPAEKWLAKLPSYLTALRMIAFPMKLEVWSYDERSDQLSIFSI